MIDSVLKIRWRIWQQLVKVSLCHQAWWLCRSCDEDGFFVFGTFLSLFWRLCFFIGTCLRYFNLHQEFYGLTTASVLFLCRVLIHLYLGISDLLEQFSIRETHIKIKLSFAVSICSGASPGRKWCPVYWENPIGCPESHEQRTTEADPDRTPGTSWGQFTEGCMVY